MNITTLNVDRDCFTKALWRASALVAASILYRRSSVASPLPFLQHSSRSVKEWPYHHRSRAVTCLAQQASHSIEIMNCRLAYEQSQIHAECPTSSWPFTLRQLRLRVSRSICPVPRPYRCQSAKPTPLLRGEGSGTQRSRD